MLTLNLPSATVWILFCVSVLLVFYGGVRLTRSGDMIARKTGIGRAWIGLSIISFATTLPELVTSVSSICLVGEPDLAAGNCFGSMAFNLLLVTFMDLLGKRRLARQEIDRGLLLSGGLFLLLLTVSLVSMLSLRYHPIACLSLWKIDFSSFVIIAVYFLTTRLVFTAGEGNGPSSDIPIKDTYADCSLTRCFALYGIAVLSVLVGGIMLAKTANAIAIATGAGQTFIGSTVVGITTSLPEMVVAFTAIRLGAIEMVLGNVLGANLFNLIIVAICDVIYRQGILLASIDENQAVTIVLVILMTMVVFLGNRFPPRGRFLGLGWDSCSLFVLYGIGLLLLYGLRMS